jgi:hypothetical protein
MNKTEAIQFNMAAFSVNHDSAEVITDLAVCVQAHEELVVDGKCGPKTRAAARSYAGPAPAVIPKYDVKFWEAYIAPFCEQHLINKRFAAKWLEVESGGNPCAVGNIAAKGPDGNPLEMGIAQFYNPDDLARLKLSGTELRAYCKPGSQSVARALTDGECKDQAEAAVKLIAQCRDWAEKDLEKVGARWGERDLAALTKLQHGLPGLSRTGLNIVTQKLGHAPATWKEYRETLKVVKLDPGTERYRSGFEKILDNAEKTASVVG